MKGRKLCLLLIILIMATTACSKQAPAKEPVSKTDFLLDTVVTITLYDQPDSTLLNQAFDLIRDYESLLSPFIPSSEISVLNANAGKQTTELSDRTINLLDKGLYYGKLSNGLLDITAGPLISLWNINPPTGHVPTWQELEVILPLINYSQFALDKENKTGYLPNEGMKINLGAIAKGYIVDQVNTLLRDNGVKSAIINAGGNIYALGEKKQGTPFKVGIQDPLTERGDYMGILSTTDESVVTSGDYERFFEEDGKKYHHILNPYNGFPSNNDLHSVTVISADSADGDALATIFLLLGLEEGKQLLSQLEDIEVIFVTKDRKLYMSEATNKRFKLTNTDYKIELFK